MTDIATNDPSGRAPRPMLIYDGDCRFCSFWVRYWEKLTGDSVRYAPYQLVAAEFPGIAESEFKLAVQFVVHGRRIASGAHATFLTLSHAPGKGFWLALYRRLPGFAAAAEAAYKFIAARREKLHGVTLLLWGRDYAPPEYSKISWLFLRGLGLIYFAAFASFAWQAPGLIGSNGVLPLQNFVATMTQRFGTDAILHAPMVFWFAASDAAINAVCWGGAAVSLLLAMNIFTRASLVLLFVFYLSVLYAGQVFTAFQWDILLLETGFLALLLASGSRIVVWLFRWLVFRFMLLSGIVKLASGDPNWSQLTALHYHFETQPLPTPLAWYAHEMPGAALSALTLAVFVIELGFPLLVFLPRRLRFLAAGGFVLLQLAILATGNYNFFNLLTLLLCLLLFDDAAIAKISPARLWAHLGRRADTPRPGKALSSLIAAFALLAAVVGCYQILATASRSAAFSWGAALEHTVAPLQLVNRYGLFAVMTTERPEIVVEGSMDGENWREYRFRYKPGDIDRRPGWNIPLQPRLDWQMWFAALGTQAQYPWFTNFLYRLLTGSPQVLALLEDNPFPEEPPRYVRALLYRYQFATPEQHRHGRWWTREPEGIYYPAIALRAQTPALQDAEGVIQSIVRPR